MLIHLYIVLAVANKIYNMSNYLNLTKKTFPVFVGKKSIPTSPIYLQFRRKYDQKLIFFNKKRNDFAFSANHSATSRAGIEPTASA